MAPNDGTQLIRPEKKTATPNFEKVHGVENLYFRHDRGVYVSRVTLNGTRSWKSLETDVRSVAILRHRKQQESIEKDRQAGAKISADFRTLGACSKEYEKRIDTSQLAEASRLAYKGNLRRLQENWQRGDFETFPVKAVTLDIIFALREYLHKEAKVEHGRTGRSTVFTKGYRNVVVNDTMLALKRLLEIAIEKRVMIETPFAGGGVLRKRIGLPRKTKIPEIPSREVMDRIFAEIREGPAAELFPGRQTWRKRHIEMANAAADFAEFLAYSGARHQEANLVKVKYYKPGTQGKVGTIYIPGFKSESSDRTIPVIPPLARLLDRLTKNRGAEEKLLLANTSLVPLQKACARLKVRRMTQHELRHYFATICLEKGCDVKAVSTWLGHSDGGALVLKTYGHLRHDHSMAQAALVDFGGTSPISSSGVTEHVKVVPFKAAM